MRFSMLATPHVGITLEKDIYLQRYEHAPFSFDCENCTPRRQIASSQSRVVDLHGLSWITTNLRRLHRQRKGAVERMSATSS